MNNRILFYPLHNGACKWDGNPDRWSPAKRNPAQHQYARYSSWRLLPGRWWVLFSSHDKRRLSLLPIQQALFRASEPVFLSSGPIFFSEFEPNSREKKKEEKTVLEYAGVLFFEPN